MRNKIINLIQYATLMDKILARFKKLRNLQERKGQRKVFLHNDLIPRNFITSEKYSTLIDFAGIAYDFPEHEFRHYRKWPMGFLTNAISHYNNCQILLYQLSS